MTPVSKTYPMMNPAHRSPILAGWNGSVTPKTTHRFSVEGLEVAYTQDLGIGEATLSRSGLYEHLIVEILRQATSSITKVMLVSSARLQSQPELEVVAQQAKNRAAILLIQQWLDDDSGYDQDTWPILKQTIEENRLSARKRFNAAILNMV